MGIGRITTFGALGFFKLMDATNIKINSLEHEIDILGTSKEEENDKVKLATLHINEELYEELLIIFTDYKYVAITKIIEYLESTINDTTENKKDEV